MEAFAVQRATEKFAEGSGVTRIAFELGYEKQSVVPINSGLPRLIALRPGPTSGSRCQEAEAQVSRG
jgi:hypothetical protein